MPTKITMQTQDIDALIKRLTHMAEDLNEAAAECLNFASTQAVTDARAQPSPGALAAIAPHQPNYIDWTGNLRSSIGAVVYKDGAEYVRFFPGVTDNAKAGSKLSPAQAAAEGEAAADTAAQAGGETFAIFSAGMSYALAVESRGYNVITDQAYQMRETFNELFKEQSDAIIKKYS